MNNDIKFNNRPPVVLSIFFPAVLFIYLTLGYFINYFEISSGSKIDLFSQSGEISSARFVSSKDLNSVIKDTVYTDQDTWIELVLPEQHAYLHYRDGRKVKYPVSTGAGNFGVSVESRPGLFAIFYRNAHHISSQFNSADMYHFMAFNQGIGFHSINGTGYYVHLGVRPSSKGCIRLTHDGARELFNATEMGTLVLVHSYNSNRVVAFAPKGFKNKKEYSKEEYRVMLARNLKNVLDGNYYISNRDYFVLDPKVIPISGAYIAYNKKPSQSQNAPMVNYTFTVQRDNLNVNKLNEIEMSRQFESIDEDDVESVITKTVNSETTKDQSSNKYVYNSKEDELIVKKYFYNPIGILPYFGPNSRR